MDQSSLPPHLREDASYRVCSKCGRKTVATNQVQCGMSQPDGSKCTGVFDLSEEQIKSREDVLVLIGKPNEQHK